MSLWNERLRIQKPNGQMAASAFRVKQMPSVLLYRRSERFDHKRFLDEELIIETKADDDRRRPYKLTARGREVAEAEAERLERMVRAARGVKLLGHKS